MDTPGASAPAYLTLESAMVRLFDLAHKEAGGHVKDKELTADDAADMAAALDESLGGYDKALAWRLAQAGGG